jgi:phage-related protein
MNFIVGIIATILDIFFPQWQEKLNKIKNFFIKVWSDLEVFISKIWKSITDFWRTVWGAIGDWFKEFWEGVKESVSKPLDWIVDKIKDALKWVEKLLSPLSKVVDMAGGGLNKLGSKLSDAFDKITRRGSEITGVDDAVISPSGNVITTDPRDYLIATQDPASLTGGGGVTNIFNISNNEIVGEDDAAEKIGDAILGKITRNKVIQRT